MTSSVLNRVQDREDQSPERALPGQPLGAFLFWGKLKLGRTRGTIGLIVEIDESRAVLDSETLALSTAEDLRTDAVSEWTSKVNATIADSRRVSLSSVGVNESIQAHRERAVEAKVAGLRQQILDLESQLQELEKAI